MVCPANLGLGYGNFNWKQMSKLIVSGTIPVMAQTLLTTKMLSQQQSALQAKLDSAFQSVIIEPEREREAELKLHADVSLSSRQRAQRQAQESDSEVDKAFVDNGTALTVL